MIITCEECATRFVLDDALIKPDGSTVRCSMCLHVFTAYPKEYPEIGISDQSESEKQDIPFDESQDQNQFDLNLSQGDDSDRDSVSHSQGDEPENKEIDFSEIEFEVEAFEETSQEDTGPSETRDLEIEFQDTTQDFDDDVLEFDTADFEIEEPDFQDDGLELEAHEIAPESASEEADIEISFDQDDDADLELGELSVDLEDTTEEVPSIDDLELETQNDEDSDLELEVDSQEDLILEEEDDDGLTLSPDPEDTLTEDVALQQEVAIETQLDIEQDDISSDDIEIEPADTDETPDDEHADEKMEPIVSDQDKFAEYDTVLEQETEPEEEAGITIPDTDEEDDTPAPPLSPDEEEIEAATETPIEPAPSITQLSAQSVRQKRSAKKKKGVNPALKILLVLALLLLAAYVAIIRLDITIPMVSDIQIPFISQWIAPKQAPQAPLKPVLDEPSIEGRFISNKSAGDLFIVTGKVTNPSDKAVSFIRVKGTLMKKNNIKAGTQIAYCGNIISDETLKADNISDITKQMGVKQGNENINVNIKPGTSVRFMLIFPNLPEDLANFTVALEGFEPAEE